MPGIGKVGIVRNQQIFPGSIFVPQEGVDNFSEPLIISALGPRGTTIGCRDAINRVSTSDCRATGLETFIGVGLSHFPSSPGISSILTGFSFNPVAPFFVNH